MLPALAADGIENPKRSFGRPQVAYNDRWLHEAVESFAKRRLEPIRIVGGGSQSDLWCQIHADVLNRVVERVEDSVNAHLRGAAVFAGLSLGTLLAAEVRDAVPVEATFRPDAATRGRYDRLYAEFPRLYKAQRRMFARLNAVGLQESSAARPHRVQPDDTTGTS